jgi:glutamate dehydrogenase (NAD(P)+)
VCYATEGALARLDGRLDDARRVVQDFGAAGQHAACFLTAHEAKLPAMVDLAGATHQPDGIDLDRLSRHEGSLVKKVGAA